MSTNFAKSMRRHARRHACYILLLLPLYTVTADTTNDYASGYCRYADHYYPVVTITFVDFADFWNFKLKKLLDR